MDCDDEKDARPTWTQWDRYILVGEIQTFIVGYDTRVNDRIYPNISNTKS